jgi:beta-glucanase (GH16 family)
MFTEFWRELTSGLRQRIRRRRRYWLVCVKTLMPVMLLAGIAPSQVFRDNFSDGKLDHNKWRVATYQSPDSIPGINSGLYVEDSFDFSHGMLCIKVTQQKKPRDGVLSFGGAIVSKQRFGFGTYEFVMRMSSTSPTPYGSGVTTTGAVSSGFVYYNNSESEIDLEFLGNENALWVTNWYNPNPKNTPKGDVKQAHKIANALLGEGFHSYTMVWNAKSVNVYLDGVLVASHTEHIPHSPAYIMVQHRGTNSDEWGGQAVVGVARYMYVRSVTFTPFKI